MNSDDTARLLERLLDDPGFRARFRNDPAEAAREAGVVDLAEELDVDKDQPLETLELRESRSSVAGVMLAAAVEGLGLFELSEHVAPQLGVEDAQAAGTEALPEPDSGNQEIDGQGLDVAEPGEEQPDVVAPDDAEPDDAGPDDAEPDEEEPDEEEPDEEEPDEEEPDEEEPDEEEPDEEEPDEEEPDEEQPDDSEPDDEASSDEEPSDEASDGQEPDDDDAADEDDTDDSTQSDSGSDEPALPPSSDWKPDPAQYGMAGGGGAQSPFDAAVLKNDHITLDANGRQDFAKGRMDPRTGALLLRLAEKHELTISSTSSDHPQSTVGGSPSNHWVGRAFDIATVDGEIVRPNSAAARKLAAELGRLDDSIRPSEIGSPWPLDVPGSFTDADHQDHIHIGFDDAVARNWSPANEARVMPALHIGQ